MKVNGGEKMKKEKTVKGLKAKAKEEKLFSNEWEYVLFAQNQILEAMGIKTGGEKDDE